jgi:hypothetical protein
LRLQRVGWVWSLAARPAVLQGRERSLARLSFPGIELARCNLIAATDVADELARLTRFFADREFLFGGPATTKLG